MSPYKAPAKPVTPGSVKIVMIMEALVLGFLSFWLIDEYMNNIFMQQYVNSVFGAHITTYTMMIGLGIGLGGTVVAALFYRSLREAKTKLDRMPSPRLKATVKQALSAIPLIDEETALGDMKPSTTAEIKTEAPPIEIITTQIPSVQTVPEPSSSNSTGEQTIQPMTDVPPEQERPHRKKEQKHPDKPA